MVSAVLRLPERVSLCWLGLATLVGVGLFSACQPPASQASPTPTVPSSAFATHQPTAIATFAPTATISAIPTSSATATATIIPTVTLSSTPTPLFSAREIIGESAAGHLLEVYRFGTGSHKRMIVAGIHGGMEANTTDLALELILHLRENPDWIPRGVMLYILPLLNPDGAALGNIPAGRANANFVDLNRNWDSHWEANPDLSGCWAAAQLSTGTAPHSEPETQALAAFLLENKIELLISYHSAGNGIYPGGQPPMDESIAFAQALAAVSSYAYPPIDAGCQYTGQLIDWAADQGITAVDVELPNKWETHLEVNLEILQVLLTWK